MSLSFSDAAKAKQLREFFTRHGRIYIVVDATGDEVDIPEYLKGDPALRLVLNVRMPQPIHIHDDVIDSEFSFSGQVYRCRIPMHMIWATYLPGGEMEQGIIWEQDMPEMIRSVVQAVRGLQDEQADEDASEEMSVAESAEVVEPVSAAEGEGRRVRHLRVIK
jgi:stringent starvation protein B